MFSGKLWKYSLFVLRRFSNQILGKMTSTGTPTPNGPTLNERYIAAMVLSGVGDAMGYRNGAWEFCDSGEFIHKELKKLGGVDKLHMKLPEWMVSDDTVMHVATAEALVTKDLTEKEDLYCCIASKYKLCMNDMTGRAPGDTCMSMCYKLKPLAKQISIPFNSCGGGCGGAMRSMCVGLRYPNPEQIDDLIAVSVEAGRLTHHHPTGFLGSMASALFTSYAIQGRPLREWGKGLVDASKMAKEYVKERKVYVSENIKAWSYFEEKWNAYLTERNLIGGNTDPVFPEKYGIKERDEFYKSLSFRGWAGASGHDAPMIAYDALLSSGGDWRELCSRSMFHSGDSDSTGVIAACCYGAMNGFNGVAECNHKDLEPEYRKRLENTAIRLYYINHPEENPIEKRSSITSDPSLEVTDDPDAQCDDTLGIPVLASVPSNNDLTNLENDSSQSDDPKEEKTVPIEEELEQRLETLEKI